MLGVKEENYKAAEVAYKKIITGTYDSLKRYTEKRKSFPEESDGLYMILEGEANIVNP